MLHFFSSSLQLTPDCKGMTWTTADVICLLYCQTGQIKIRKVLIISLAAGARNRQSEGGLKVVDAPLILLQTTHITRDKHERMFC